MVQSKENSEAPREKDLPARGEGGAVVDIWVKEGTGRRSQWTPAWAPVVAPHHHNTNRGHQNTTATTPPREQQLDLGKITSRLHSIADPSLGDYRRGELVILRGKETELRWQALPTVATPGCGRGGRRQQLPTEACSSKSRRRTPARHRHLPADILAPQRSSV
jgi:hypothetical protein